MAYAIDQHAGAQAVLKRGLRRRETTGYAAVRDNCAFEERQIADELPSWLRGEVYEPGDLIADGFGEVRARGRPPRPDDAPPTATRASSIGPINSGHHVVFESTALRDGGGRGGGRFGLAGARPAAAARPC